MKNTTNINKYIILALICLSFLATLYVGKAQAYSLDEATKMAGSLTTPTYSFWANFQSHLLMDHRVDQRAVQAEIHALMRNKEKFQSILDAATPYIYYIHERTEKLGLPDELALIPVIESEFSPGDRSSVGATGLWQLMPATARELGVKVQGGYDGRRNVIYSTNAALLYFRDIGRMYRGDWYLAIAAYNTGSGNVNRAIRYNGTRDFFKLTHLADETRHYVPRLLAVAEIVKHPAKYGITLPVIKNQPYFAEVKTKAPLSLTKVAQATGVALSKLKRINPDYNHKLLAKNNAFMLLVPISKVSIVKKIFADKVIS